MGTVLHRAEIDFRYNESTPGETIRDDSIESSRIEGCPILSHRVHWKMGHNDSFDLSNGE